ncbi:hypothetical protein GCM10023115_10530 [Pontixanthobacter gangjinensis]|uniref:Dienelactone hydrolase n=1 Tax=Pontixanthobacter gangjinensis TaxID=1028742 RepID=A0A6I4SKK1_9SPHN|nr:prolyl oligopeptidase family serine peptidase [Pontixanthobacter gangjinensis]MXO56299.1 dienelactone hydrolase [Pontixanthobacter gangjinensis]
MKKRYIAVGLAGVLLAGAATTAYVVTPTVHPGQSGESPELGRTGEFAVGTELREYALPDRTRIDGWGALTGSLDEVERKVSVRIWYPAQQPSGAEALRYEHTMEPRTQVPVKVVSQGIAFDGAQPLTGEKFPLVLMSHGFGGWDTQFSNLGEHIASRGYVVASIDHADQQSEGLTDFLISFGNVLVDRTLDQRQVLDQIVSAAQSGGEPVSALIDPEHIGLIGYSMGGYGAIATAGAPYSFTNEPMANLPTAAQEQLVAATADAADIDALVAFAPWGGQPDNRAWTAESLAKINVPTLVVAGNQDDVVNYSDGVTWLFDNLIGSDRYMLVYREARHNIVGNAFEMPEDSSFTASEFLMEPVWRGERLNAINQHFVTAFLDMTLKGDTSKADYLNVPAVDSNDSNWEVAFGEQLNGTLAGDGQPEHWRGFQRRWAIGLEMYAAKAGKAGKAAASGAKASK